jgi:hypothetical protein
MVPPVETMLPTKLFLPISLELMSTRFLDMLLPYLVLSRVRMLLKIFMLLSCLLSLY